MRVALKPSLRAASCCRVEVVKGGKGCRLTCLRSTSATLNGVTAPPGWLAGRADPGEGSPSEVWGAAGGESQPAAPEHPGVGAHGVGHRPLLPRRQDVALRLLQAVLGRADGEALDVVSAAPEEADDFSLLDG